MKIHHALSGLALAAAACLSFAGATYADGNHDLNVTNHTGHAVAVFLFQDDHVHLNETGGSKLQAAVLADGGSAVAHVPSCKFSILLLDGQDVWHAEFHDCTSTEMAFTATTGHAHRAP